MDPKEASLNRSAKIAIDARIADNFQLAASCAAERREPYTLATIPLPCPCGLIEAARFWFGPSCPIEEGGGWRCGVCLKPASVTAYDPKPKARHRTPA